MKILVTVNTFYPLKDGVQNVTEYLLSGLVKKGHEITVLTPRYNGLMYEEEYKGIKIIRVNVFTKFGIYFGKKRQYKKLVIELSKKHDVLINVCTQNAMTDLLYSSLKKMPCKKLLHVHGVYDFKWHKTDFKSFKTFCYKIWKDIRWSFLYSFRNFKEYDKVIQLHRFDKGYSFFYKKYGIKSAVLENSCEKAFESDSKSYSSEAMAICVANFSERKNQEFVLKSFYYSSKSSQAKLVLIGSKKTPYCQKLIELKKTLDKKIGYRKVDILYNLSREETIEMIKESTFYLLGSTWEAFPISIVEALACSKPFVSRDVGIVKYLPGGIIVSNELEMAYWIDTFLNYNDIVTGLGDIGHKYYLNNLSLNVTIEKFERIIRGCFDD